MTIPGLPPIDIPLHQRDPRDCRKCKQSYYDADDEALRYARCARTGNMCVFERDKDSACGPEAKHWMERGTK